MCPCCCCCCYWRTAWGMAFSSQRDCVWQLTQFLLPGKGGSGENRISHPDWVKLCVELNMPNQNTFCYITVSPVITAFHSCCLSNHVFDLRVRIETAIVWQCSPGTVETQRLYPLRHGPRRRSRLDFFVL